MAQGPGGCVWPCPAGRPASRNHLRARGPQPAPRHVLTRAGFQPRAGIWASGRPGRVPRSILCAQNAAVQHASAMRQYRDARAPAQTSSARKLHMQRHHGLSAPCGEAYGLLKDECGLAVRHLRLALLLLLSSEAALRSQQASGRPRTPPASTATASRGIMAWVCAVWSTTAATRCARVPEDEAEQQWHQRPVHAHSRRRARC
jgi:hypothetical protein